MNTKTKEKGKNIVSSTQKTKKKKYDTELSLGGFDAFKKNKELINKVTDSLGAENYTVKTVVADTPSIIETETQKESENTISDTNLVSSVPEVKSQPSQNGKSDKQNIISDQDQTEKKINEMFQLKDVSENKRKNILIWPDIYRRMTEFQSDCFTRYNKKIGQVELVNKVMDSFLKEVGH